MKLRKNNFSLTASFSARRDSRFLKVNLFKMDLRLDFIKLIQEILKYYFLAEKMVVCLFCLLLQYFVGFIHTSFLN